MKVVFTSFWIAQIKFNTASTTSINVFPGAPSPSLSLYKHLCKLICLFGSEKNSTVSTATSVPNGSRISWWALVCCLCLMLKYHPMWGLSQFPFQNRGTLSAGQLHLWLFSLRSKFYHGGPLLVLSGCAAYLVSPSSTLHHILGAHSYPESCAFGIFCFFFQILIPKKETSNKISQAPVPLTKLSVLTLSPVPAWVSPLLMIFPTYTPHL